MVRRTNVRPLAGFTAAALLAAPLALGCGGSQAKPEDDKPAAAEKTTASDKAQPAGKPKDSEQLEPITIKKGEKKSPEAAFLDKPDPGNVSIDFKNLDLGKVALPLFSKQAGVIVEYGGPPRNVSIHLQNVPWRDALDYMCRFTGTHAVASQIRGRIELKLGAAPSKPFLDRFDPNSARGADLSGGADGAASDAGASSGGAPATTAGASSGASSSGASPEPGSGEIEDPNAKGKATIEKLRTGVSTTNSGQ